MRNLVLGFVLSVLATACEKHEQIRVTVLDGHTQAALAGVKVVVQAGWNGNYNKNRAEGLTDSTGTFETRMMIGCAMGCYDISMAYSKAGYAPKTELNRTTGTVYLYK